MSMMKKTISLLAALTLTLTAMGAVAAGAESYDGYDYGYTGVSLSLEAEQAAEEIEAARLAGDAEAEAEATDKYYLAMEDPEYFKVKQRQEEAGQNAGGGNDDAAKMTEGDILAIERSLAATQNYCRYTDQILTHDSRFDKYNKVFGIDVSEHQKNIDWNQVRADGIRYAIIRVGYRGWGTGGTLQTDQYFYNNIQNAKAAGLKVGLYFYTQAVNTYEAREEAAYVISQLKASGCSIDMPIYYDIEAVGNGQARLDVSGLSKSQKTQLCTAFCEYIKSQGYKAGVYSYRNYFYSDIDGPALATLYPVWLADYTYDTATDSQKTPYTGGYHMWQFSSKAVVEGINCQNGLDINVFYDGYSNVGGSGTEIGSPGSTANPSNPSNPGNPTTSQKPSKPDGVTYVQDSSTGSITIKWNKAENASYYEVYSYNGATGKYTSVASTTSTYYTMSDPDTSLTYCVRGVTSNNGTTLRGDFSEAISIGDCIGGFKATVKTGAIDLSWEDTDADVYYVYRSTNGSSFEKVGETYNNYFSDTSISGSVQRYYYYVQSYVDGDADLKTNTLAVSFAPAKCEAPQLVSCNDSAVTLKWNGVTGAAGYQVLQYNPASGKYKLKADVKSNVERKFTVGGLTSGDTYKFAVRAYTLNGDTKTFGNVSEHLVVKTVPPVVTGLTYTETATGIKLSWKASNGADQYIVYKKDTSGYTRLGSVKSTAVNINMSLSGEKQFAVCAGVSQNNSVYQSTYSTPVSVKTKNPGQPVITSGSYVNGAVTITWTPTANASGYRIYRYNSQSKTYKSVKTINGKDASSYTIYNIPAGATEKFKVKAYKRDGANLTWSKASAAYTLKTQEALPAPTGLYATATDSQILLAWNAVDGAYSYNVYEVTGSGTKYLGETKKITCTIKNTGGTKRTYVVSANAKSGETKTAGAMSAQAVAPASVGIPTLSVANNTANSIKLKWNIPSGATGVRLYMYDKNKKTYVKIKTLSSKKTALTVKNLAAGSEYKFKIKAYSKSGTGIIWSKASSAMTAYTNY